MTEQPTPTDTLLIVDDDEIFCSVLSNALGKRGYSVTMTHNVGQAINSFKTSLPDFAVVDLNMPGESGLELIPKLCKLNPNVKIVVLTGYASITTAVEAIKLGAIHYLSKPADADEIVAGFYHEDGNPEEPISETPLSVERLEWEHIQKVLKQCDGNISEAARQLNMHRRTLQRKLQKRPVRR